MTAQPTCGSDYHADTGTPRRPGDRAVRCGLPPHGRDVDHAELLDGEPGPAWPWAPEPAPPPAADPPPFAEWAICELLGHRRVAGLVAEVRLAGAGFLRVDIPEVSGYPARTQYVAPGSVYALHPCSEDTARRAAVAFAGSAAPVQRWELEAATPTTRPDDDPGDTPPW